MKEKQQSIYKKVSLKELILFGGGEGFSLNILFVFITSYLMYYATDIYGISVAFAGLILTIGRVFDAISDPIIGNMIDRTNTKRGQFRPWIFWGSIIAPLAMVLMFSGLQISMKFGYMTAMYLLFTLGYTMLAMSVHSARSTMTNDPAQRVWLTVPGMLTSIVAVGIVMIGTIPFTEAAGTNPLAQWRLWTVILAVLGFAGWRVFTLSLKNKDKYNPNRKKGEKITLSKQGEVLKSNKALQMLIISSATNDMATGFTTAVNVYFFAHVLRRTDLVSVSAMLILPIGLIMGVVVGLLANKYSKKNIFKWGSYLGLIIPTIMIIFRPFENITLLIILLAIGTGIGIITSQTRWAMVPDCVDYGEWKTGLRTPGIVTSVFTFFNKFGMAIPGVIVGAILAGLGFVVGGHVQGLAVQNAIVLMLFGGPLLGHLCSIVAIHFYPITRVFYKQMIEDLNARNAAKEN